MDGYFIHDGNIQQGPFTVDQLKEKSIRRDTPVWKKGLTDWTRAGDIIELKSLFENTPPAFQIPSRTTTSHKKTLTEKTGTKLGKFLGWTGLFPPNSPKGGASEDPK
jgi:hypothetical protein